MRPSPPSSTRCASLAPIAATEEAFVLTPREDLRLSEFFAAVERLGLSYRYFTVTRPTLENVFLHLTGKTLRDA